jgi:dipeptidyl aminopeptidase/acylaminoacyl peptidase
VGESWGGYLALLAAGVQPTLWHAAAAINPVADYIGAFRQTTAAVRALDVRLFGGGPDEKPTEYARSSPLTYAAQVRAPVLIVAGSGDAKCPPAQVRTYVDALRRNGRRPEVVWTAGGHQSVDVDGRIEAIRSVVRHVGLALGGSASGPESADLKEVKE